MGKTEKARRANKKPKQHAAICPSCERLPVWLRDWPATVSTQLMAGTAPTAVKAAARELWERYCDRVVDAIASEIRGECLTKWVCGQRKHPTPPWYDQDESEAKGGR